MQILVKLASSGQYHFCTLVTSLLLQFLRVFLSGWVDGLLGGWKGGVAIIMPLVVPTDLWQDTKGIFVEVVTKGSLYKLKND